MPEYIYRVTEINDEAPYWKPKRRTRIVTKRSVKAILAQNTHVTAIERAPVGDWEEIETAEEIL